MTFEQLHRHLWQAYLITIKGKRSKPACLCFEMDADLRVAKLAKLIYNRKYVPAPAMSFIHQESVKREIFASVVEHRVVCTLLYLYLYPLYKRLFIHDSYGSQPGKGPLVGIERFEHHLRSVTENYTKPAYVLKLDIRSFFVSIDKKILRRIIDEDLDKHWHFFKENDSYFGDSLFEERELINYLLDVILHRDPTKGCILLGPKSEREGLIASKSLFNSPPGVGLVLGDVTSQLFSNIFLHRLDLYVKRVLKMRDYGRYMDDSYMMHNDGRYLYSLIGKISRFLLFNLHLNLHPKKIIFQPCTCGVTYLGAHCKPWVRYPSSRVVHSFRNKMRSIETFLAGCCYPTKTKTEEMRSVINSYCGYLRHFASFNIESDTFEKCVCIRDCFSFSEGFSKAIIKSKPIYDFE